MKNLILSFLTTVLLFVSTNTYAADYPMLHYKLTNSAQQQGLRSPRLDNWMPLSQKALNINFYNILVSAEDGDSSDAINNTMLKNLKKFIQQRGCTIGAYVNDLAPSTDCSGSGVSSRMAKQNTPFVGDKDTLNYRTSSSYSSAHALSLTTTYRYRFSVLPGSVGTGSPYFPLHTFGGIGNPTIGKNDLILYVKMEIKNMALNVKDPNITLQADPKNHKNARHGLGMYIAIPSFADFKGKSLKESGRFAVKNAKLLLTCTKIIKNGQNLSCKNGKFEQ